MTATDKPATDTLDHALVALATVVFCMSMVLREWAQALAVAALVVVVIAKHRDPEAAWLTWMPRISRR